MKRIIIITGLLIAYTNLSNAQVLPAWFKNTFFELKLDKKYIIIKPAKPAFLQVDFNGDKRQDVAVQIMDIETKKKGILIINAISKKPFVFGAGSKFKSENYDNTNWLSGWRINYNKVVYESRFAANGDILAGRKIKIKYPSIYAYSLEDGEEYTGVLIYWDGANYTTIHQGE